jgi:hypothetical protein
MDGLPQTKEPMLPDFLTFGLHKHDKVISTKGELLVEVSC